MDLPDYSGGSIVNLMASLQAGLSGEKHAYPPLRQLSPDEVGRHRQVILWIIDGLGYDYLTAHADALHLNAALAGCMTSVYPPTTASAVTTFLTGEAPQQHGITGWFVYFRELGSILTVLPGRARYGGSGYGAGGIDAAKLLAHRAFVDRIGVESYTLSPAYIVDSEFNRAHLGASTPIGFNSLQEMCDKLLELGRRQGRRFIYLYWPELDTIGHHAGIWSEQAASHLRQLDQAFQRMCEGLQGSDTLLLVCADHGQIDTRPEQALLLDDYPELQKSLVLPLCGEPRSAYCYLRPGYESLFDETVSKRFRGLANLYPSSSLIEQGWFGLGAPHPRLAERIGDRVLLMQKRASLKDWLAQEKPFQMIGTHGGLSREELWVPLIIADC
ncbi:MAG: alkaline phosphatase family protein [Chromatiales bacterium]|jgi:predicted AlkP superfamily pyrophosphatase or phosphodiesterase